MPIDLTELLRNKNQTGSSLANDLPKTIEQAKDILSQIVLTFPTYTEHTIDHTIRVRKHLETILPKCLAEKMNEHEIYCLLAAVYLHDIGMWNTPKLPLPREIDQKDNEAVRKYIRKNHHIRGEKYVVENHASLFIYDPMAAVIIGKIIRAHIDDLDSDYYKVDRPLGTKGVVVNEKLLGTFLKIADDFDLTSERTSELIYEQLERSGLDKVGKQEWERQLQTFGWVLQDGEIRVSSRCSSPEIYRKLREIEAHLNKELSNLRRYLERYSECANDLPRRARFDIEYYGQDREHIDEEIRNKAKMEQSKKAAELESKAEELNLSESLKKLEISPSKELSFFLEARNKATYWDTRKWGLAVDWHVILPYGYIGAKPGLWKINVEIDPTLNEERHKKEIAETLGLDHSVVEEIVNSIPTPDPNRPKYYVHDIDDSSALLDSKGEIKFILGYTTYRVYRAINKAMETPLPALGNKTLAKHIENLKLPLPKGELSRHVFMVRIAIHMAVITRDPQPKIVIACRGRNVDINPSTERINIWALPVSESMKADETFEKEKEIPPDRDFYDTALRGLKEELGVEELDKSKIDIIAFTGELNTLDFSVFAIYRSRLTGDQIKADFPYKKKDRESRDIQIYPLDLNTILSLLKERNPNLSDGDRFSPGGSRLMWLLVLMREFGIEEVKNAISLMTGKS